MTFDLENEWADDFQIFERGTRSGLIEIETAKKWHAAYRKAQNSNLLRKQEIERLRSEKTFLEKVVHIKNTSLKELEANLEQSERVVEARLEVVDQQAAQIRELEDALVEERARMDHSMIRGSSCKFYDECNHGNFCGFVGCPHKTDFLGFARSQLVAEGKIGPDAKPRVWKITEERKAAIRDAEIALRDAVLDSNDPHCWDAETAVLRAMLEEAILEAGI